MSEGIVFEDALGNVLLDSTTDLAVRLVANLTFAANGAPQVVPGISGLKVYAQPETDQNGLWADNPQASVSYDVNKVPTVTLTYSSNLSSGTVYGAVVRVFTAGEGAP